MIPSIEQLASAAALLIDESPGAPEEHAATKALWHLGRGLEVIELPGVFLIPSGTHAGRVYRVTSSGCSCEASGPCWHYACVVIVEFARGQQAALHPSYADAVAAMDELFA